ncbi:unnamed protein product [marine sediment metagenome]|uniref:Uncharacterized protein n=1 Tax=marine sediment metagenome TaxID=412755 RepID=X1AQI2_9ZZZZ
MIVTQTDTLPTTLAESTVLTFREVNSYNRMISFENLTTSSLSFKVEYSADGGATWNSLITSFTVTAGANVVKTTENGNILRILGSGVTDSRGVMISYTRFFLDATHIWSSPVV